MILAKMDSDLDEHDDLPATQPISSVLMNGVVAYVEVRSGHDNRSRGIKAKLRSLGAKVVDTLSNEVTHVVFNEGFPSTYKKAKRLRCYLVSVLWIEACSEALDIVSEADYPPIGLQTYENPQALKSFKKMKSMQPDFEEDVCDQKLNKILKNIQRRKTNPRASPRKKDQEISGPKRRQNHPGPRKRKLHPVSPQDQPRRQPWTVCFKTKKKRPQKQPLRSSSKQEVSHGIKGPLKDVTNKDSSSFIAPPCLEVLSSEASNSSSVIFCGVEDCGSLSLQKSCSTDVSKNVPRRDKSNTNSMSRDEFVTHIGDLVEIMRTGNQATNSLQKSTEPSKKFQSSSLFENCSRLSWPTTSHHSDSKDSKPCFKKEDSKVPASEVKRNCYLSASAFLLRRQMQLEKQANCVKEISPDVSVTSVKSSNNFGNTEISQISKAYDEFAENYKKKTRNASAFETPLNQSKVVCVISETSASSLDTEPLTKGINETEPISCSNGISHVGGNSVHDDSCSKIQVENSSCKVNHENSFQERCTSNPSENCDKSELNEKQLSPVFHTKKFRFKRGGRCAPIIDFKRSLESSSFQYHEDEFNGKEFSVASSRQLPIAPLLPNTANFNEEECDAVQYLNKTVESLKQTLIPCLSGTLISQGSKKDVGSKYTFKEDDNPSRTGFPEDPNQNSVGPTKDCGQDQQYQDSVHNSLLVFKDKIQRRPLFASAAYRDIVKSPQKSEEFQLCHNNSASVLEKPRGLQKEADLLGNGSINAPSAKIKEVLGKGHQCSGSRGDTSVKHQKRLSVEDTPKAGSTTKKLKSLPDIPTSTKVNHCGFINTGAKSFSDSTSVPLKKKSEAYELQYNVSSRRVASELKSETSSYDSAFRTEKSDQHFKSVSAAQEKDSPACLPSGTQHNVLANNKLNKRSNRSIETELEELSNNSSCESSRKSYQEAKKKLTKTQTQCQSKHSKVIVCTFLTASELFAIQSSLNSLSGWSMESKVSHRTTHVVNSGPKRTLNMLRGMAQGCWLVHVDWVHESSKNGEWLNEEKFEFVEFSPAVKPSRLSRQAHGKNMGNILFNDVGPIFVSPKTNSPPAKDIRELIQLWGGKVTLSRKTAHMVVGTADKILHSVKAIWILDCISKNKVLPISVEYEIV